MSRITRLTGGTRAVLLSALILGAVSHAPTDADPVRYRLHEPSATGDVCDVTSQMKMGVSLTISVGERSVPAAVEMDSIEKYRETILAADAAGAPVAYRRSYSVKKQSVKDPLGEPKTEVSSLQGKTVEVRDKAGKQVVTVLKGTVADADREEATHRIDPDRDFFPDHEVAPGDDWDIKPEAIGVSKGTRGSVKGHFKDVVPHGGHRCARLWITADLNIESEEENLPPMRLSMAGFYYYALDLQRSLGMDLSGTASMKAMINQDGNAVTIEGSGPVSARWTAAWSKVAGKALAPGH